LGFELVFLVQRVLKMRALTMKMRALGGWDSSWTV